MDWDDMKLVLAICRAGTLSGAARDLGVNYSTIFRRICGIEKDLNLKLLERHKSGYAMTEADLAVRIAKKPPENYIAREICKVRFGDYGSPEYVHKYGHLAPHDHRWITNREHPKPCWAGDKDRINVVFTTDSREADIEAARRGLGLGHAGSYRFAPSVRGAASRRNTGIFGRRASPVASAGPASITAPPKIIEPLTVSLRNTAPQKTAKAGTR